jgi:hypothetical protein
MKTFKGFITEMATFSAKNFPTNVGNNSKFVGAGERTTYVPVSSNQANYKYDQGFSTSKATPLYNKNGTIIKQLPSGQTVYFIYPAELYNSTEFGITARTILAGVSLKSYNGKLEGYIPISSVIKPAGKNQGRVGTGSKTQDMVANYIKDFCYKNKIEVEDQYKVATAGSTVADLIMTIAGKKVQFEIKGTNNKTAPITFFDKSVKRSSKTPELIDQIAKVYIDKLIGKNNINNYSFIGLIDYYKSKDSTVGLAGDLGVTKSGKLPSQLITTDASILSAMRDVILNHFAKEAIGGDDFFVVHDRSTDNFDVYYVAGGKAGNVLGASPLPKFKSFALATYGGASGGSTRVGLKIKL